MALFIVVGVVIVVILVAALVYDRRRRGVPLDGRVPGRDAQLGEVAAQAYLDKESHEQGHGGGFQL